MNATFGLLNGGRTAVVETAAASGFRLARSPRAGPLADEHIRHGRVDPGGTGHRRRNRPRGRAGSATVDGDDGALRALDGYSPNRVRGRLVVLCDVDTGWEDCASVYDPQKARMAQLTARLRVYGRGLPRDPRGVPRTGAAGDLSGALWAAFDATLAAGAACSTRCGSTIGWTEPEQRSVARVSGRPDDCRKGGCRSCQTRIDTICAGRCNCRSSRAHRCRSAPPPSRFRFSRVDSQSVDGRRRAARPRARRRTVTLESTAPNGSSTVHAD